MATARSWTNGSGLALSAANLNAMETGIAVNPLTLPGSNMTGNARAGQTIVTVDSTQHNAFPGLTLCSDGNLLAVWRNAPQHDPTPTPGVIMACKYGPNLQPLGAAYTVLTDTYDLRDPMLTRLSDGRIIMQYFKHDGTATTQIGVFLAVSSDDGATFSQLCHIPFSYWNNLIACSGKMTVAPNGDWLVAAYGDTTTTFENIRLMRSTDGGSTWTGEVHVADGQASSQNFTETVIGLLPDGQTLMCLIRVANSDGTNPCIYRTISTDNANTWSTATSVLTNVSGRPAWISLASGGVLLCARSGTAPYPMQFWVSWDSGNTWSTVTQLGATPASQGTYAQPYEIAPGLIGVAFAIEASISGSSTLYATYLADGYGYSPAKDDFTDPEGIIVKWAGEGGTVGGASVASQVLGWPVWTLTKSSGDQCAFAFKVPSSWRTFNIDLLWTNYVGGTAGNIYFRYDYEQIDVNGTLTSVAGASAAVATAGQYVLVATPYAINVARKNAFLRVKPTRLGTNANDTYASSIAVVGVRLTRTA